MAHLVGTVAYHNSIGFPAFGVERIAEPAVARCPAPVQIAVVAGLRAVHFDEMVAFGLLFAADYHVGRKGVECVAALLFLCDGGKLAVELIGGHNGPVDHIAAFVERGEGHEAHAVVFSRINAVHGECERLAGNRLEARCDVGRFGDYNRHILQRQTRTGRNVTAAAVIGHQTLLALAAEVGGKHHGTVEERVVCRAVGELFGMQVHG